MDPKRVKRILVPLDFSASSDEALSTAIAFARAFSAHLELVHVIVEPIYPLPAPLEVVTLPVDIERIYTEVEKQMTFALGRVREAGVSGEKVILNGRPHVEIASHAEKTKADLIVIGSHGRSGFSHALLGSVAERVVHRARCPVLVVPPTHTEADLKERPAAAAARGR